MAQRSILHYFPRLQPKSPHVPIAGFRFHELPWAARRLIYYHCDLVRDCPIAINFDDNEQRPWCESTHTDGGCYFELKKYWHELVENTNGRDCICSLCEPLPYSLFFVSRSISNEALSIFYSENKFTIFGSGIGGLSRLRKLNAERLFSITSLTISFTSCSCVPDHVCDLPRRKCDCHLLCKRGNGWPLAKHRSNRLAKELKFFCDRLVSFGNPSGLRLALICDCRDIETAQRIVEPLSAFHIKPLQECAIRLGQKPSVELRMVAEDAARRATGKPTRFRYTDLPDELQVQILERSELVAHRDLIWAPGVGFLGQAVCCFRCTDALEACCCPQLHAGYSTTCILGSCWQFPLSIFLVSRKIHTDAVRIFYQMNHFIIVPGQERSSWAGMAEEPLRQGEYSRPLRRPHCSQSELDLYVPLSRFLGGLPQLARPHLRSVHWILHDLEPMYMLEDPQLCRQWHNTVNFMNRELDIPKFSLTVDMSRAVHQIYWEGTPNFDCLHKNYGRDEWVVQAYRSLCRSLVPLRESGLPRLFIHISYPLEEEASYPFRGKYCSERFALEESLEKIAMGDAYDSSVFDPNIRIPRSRPRGLIWERHAWWSFGCCKTRVDLENFQLINCSRPFLSIED